MGYLTVLCSLLIAYLLGAIPTSYIFARSLKGLDIRQHGSGNVGATNVLRVVGRLPAFVVLIIDIAKGSLAVTVLPALIYNGTLPVGYELFRILLGFSVIAGHIWTVFLKFKGGKGVATTIGVLAFLAPQAFVPSLLVWVAVFAATRYVSVASLSFGVVLPIFAALLGLSFSMTFFCICLCFLNTYKHQANIRRLVRGEEPKTVFSKSKG